MMFIYVENDNIIGAGLFECGTENVENIEVTQQVYDAWLNDHDKYIYSDGEIVENPDYVEIKKQREQERLNALTMTKADFWIALLDRDITKNDVIEKINLIPDEKLKAKTLIRINDADHFWRGDASMDVVGARFGITSQDLNYLFEHKELPGETPEVIT